MYSPMHSHIPGIMTNLLAQQNRCRTTTTADALDTARIHSSCTAQEGRIGTNDTPICGLRRTHKRNCSPVDSRRIFLEVLYSNIIQILVKRKSFKIFLDESHFFSSWIRSIRVIDCIYTPLVIVIVWFNVCHYVCYIILFSALITKQ